MTVGLLSFGQTVVSNPFVLNVTFDTNTTLGAGVPQDFFDKIEAARLQLANAIQNAITVNLQVGYGTISNSAGSFSSAGAGTSDIIAFKSYATCRAAYIANSNGSSSDVLGVRANLPAGSSISGSSSLQLNQACDKALGISVPARQSGVDAYCGFGVSVPSANLTAVALHEFTHALGRIPDRCPYLFSRFTSVGVFATSASAGVTNYLSIDGGTTSLVNLDTTPDGSFNAGLDDPFNVNYVPGSGTQTLTVLDKRVLNMLGYTVV